MGGGEGEVCPNSLLSLIQMVVLLETLLTTFPPNASTSLVSSGWEAEHGAALTFRY